MINHNNVGPELAAISPSKRQLLQEDLELEELIKQSSPAKMGPLILAELARVADKGFCGPEYLAKKHAEKQEQSEQTQSSVTTNSPSKKDRSKGFVTTALVSSERRQTQQDEAKLFSIVRRYAPHRSLIYSFSHTHRQLPFSPLFSLISFYDIHDHHNKCAEITRKRLSV